MATNTTICCQSAVMAGNGWMTTRTNTAMAAILGAAAKNAVTGVGAPSYTSGVHMWNGTAETLKASPASRNTSPKVSPMLVPVSARCAAITLKLVEPVKP